MKKIVLILGAFFSLSAFAQSFSPYDPTNTCGQQQKKEAKHDSRVNPFVFCSGPRPCKKCHPEREIYDYLCKDSQATGEQTKQIQEQAICNAVQGMDPATRAIVEKKLSIPTTQNNSTSNSNNTTSSSTSGSNSSSSSNTGYTSTSGSIVSNAPTMSTTLTAPTSSTSTNTTSSSSTQNNSSSSSNTGYKSSAGSVVSNAPTMSTTLTAPTSSTSTNTTSSSTNSFFK